MAKKKLTKAERAERMRGASVSWRTPSAHASWPSERRPNSNPKALPNTEPKGDNWNRCPTGIARLARGELEAAECP